MEFDLSILFFNFLKVLFVVGGGLYVVFAVIVIRQIFTMQRSLVTSFSAEIKILGFAHLGFALAILFYFGIAL